MRVHGIRPVLLALLLLLSAGTLGVAGQQQSNLGIRIPDDQQIENAVGEMLAGWQIGDLELLKKHYADDVMVVSGLYEPPIIGLGNYLAAYQNQRQRMQGVRMDRRNTFIKVRANFAWATYQWEFAATADGRPTGAQGHATLLFEKRGDRWLIIHNHTSVVSMTAAQPPQQVPQAQAPSPGKR